MNELRERAWINIVSAHPQASLTNSQAALSSPENGWLVQSGPCKALLALSSPQKHGTARRLGDDRPSRMLCFVHRVKANNSKKATSMLLCI
jgi:hypothetical protein